MNTYSEMCRTISPYQKVLSHVKVYEESARVLIVVVYQKTCLIRIMSFSMIRREYIKTTVEDVDGKKSAVSGSEKGSIIA